MPIILAIEPDRRQRHALGAVVRQRVGAELILADTTERALEAIGNRVPDLVLVPALLSPQDDAALAAALRVIAAAAHVRTLTIPVLATEAKSTEPRTGLLARWWRGDRDASPAPDGCDPAVFADQVIAYLAEAAAARALVKDDTDDAYTVGAFGADEQMADMPAVIALDETFVAPEQAFAAEAPAPAYSEDGPAVAPNSPAFVVDELSTTATDTSSVAAEREAATFADESTAIDQPLAAVDERFVADGVKTRNAFDAEPVMTVVQTTLVEEPAMFAIYGGSDQNDDIDLSGAVAELIGEEDAAPATAEVVTFDSEPIAVTWLPMPVASATPVADLPLPEVHLSGPAQSAHHAVAAAAEPLAPLAGDELFEHEIIEEFTGGNDTTPGADLAADAAIARRQTADADAWLSASLCRPQTWPRLEGVPAEIRTEAPRTAPAAARDCAERPVAPPTRERNEWTELVASLRQDIERRRTEPAVRAEAAAPVAPAKPRPQAAVAKAKPTQDEWGFFDPQQCGFAALLAKLDEITEAPDERDSPRH